MTLHWWMHWFWVTALLTLAYGSGSRAAPTPPELQSLPDMEPELHPERRGRAMYFAKTTFLPTPSTTTTTTTTTTTSATVPNTTEPMQPENATATEETAAVTEEATTTETPPVVTAENATREAGAAAPSEPAGAPGSSIVTGRPLSLETTYLQTRIPAESSRRVNDDRRGLDTGEIAGASFAALALVALAASTGFVVYRRRYLNKPQTLNDKCSNPDSSGYLDDSTVRDNSEEMYSLDNDSFLNSLEAMTIQNYWTDTVKHTKL